MHRFTPLFLATALSIGSSPLAPQDEVRDPKPTQSKSARAAAKKTVAKMQGAWRLTEIQLVEADKMNFGDQPLDHVGYCLVSGNYMSIEFHFRILPDEADRGRMVQEPDRGRSFVTGLHRFEMEDAMQMETSSLIATTMGRIGLPQFERPETKRHYEVTLAANSMVLTRDDGHTLTFERVQDDERDFDIFGRPVREKDDEEAGSGEKQDERSGEKKEGGG